LRAGKHAGGEALHGNNRRMETKWLEDFVSLAETRSFSRSAQLRHVTQPAFSRRIQALEAWAGTDLVDRSSYPTRLTPAGETLYSQSLEMLQALQSTRAMLRGHSAAGQDVIEFAVPHTLAFTFFPAWVSSLREKFGPIKSRLIALNVHDAVMRLVEGGCDIFIGYHHASQPFQLDADRYEMVTLGEESIAPYCKPDSNGEPLFKLPGRAGQPLPYLGYAPGAYLGRVTDLILKQSRTAIHLDRVYETDMAEGLKVMALEGHGIAFLPHSAVKKELRSRRLVSASGVLEGLEMAMDVRAYREKPVGKEVPKGTAQALWKYLSANAGAK
jgi:LysR family transcriptional regulator, hypochlorite-specific transcription factor HypT